MNFSFKLCHDSDIDSRLRDALSRAFCSLRPRLEALAPTAIILSGSLARGEGTAYSNNGALWLNSDFDALVVFKDRAESSHNTPATKKLAEDIAKHLERQNIFCRVEFGIIRLDSFLKFQPAIGVYELKTMGKAIWGDESVLSLIRPFSTHDIPKWDAFEMMNNRLIELLIAFQGILNERECDVQRQEAAAYSLLKMYIDMATAILVFQGKYEPTYEARARRFKEVTHGLKDTPFYPYLPELTDMVLRCTDFKLHQRSSTMDFFAQKGYDLSCSNQLLSEWRRLSMHVKPVWMWMANDIAGGNYTEDASVLVKLILKKETLYKWLKGWAKLCLGLKRENRLGELQYMRLLSGLALGSPETNIRCSGALLYLYMHKFIETGTKDMEILYYVKRGLPYLSSNSSDKVGPELLIRELEFNYKKFVRLDYSLKPPCSS
ncbi:MAG TPA: hypothetical protein ACFYD3_06170 [Candidatus Hypogeohydataceae bacterium YC41]